jgi:hypothetical protein
MTYQEEMDRVLTRATRAITPEELYKLRLRELVAASNPREAARELVAPRNVRRSPQGRRK